MVKLIAKADKREQEAKARHISEKMEQDLEFFKDQTKHLDKLSRELQRELFQTKQRLRTAQEAERFMHDRLLEAKKANVALIHEVDKKLKPANEVREEPKPDRAQNPDLYEHAELLLKENEELRTRLFDAEYERKTLKV